MKRSSWLYIEPYVHISIKSRRVLLYNTLNGKVIEDDYPPIVRLVNRLRSNKNLLVIKLANKEIDDPKIAGFVRKAREYFVGDLLDESFSQGKPVEMMPKLHMHKGIKLKDSKESMIWLGQGIMDYLAEISLYINDSCRQDCSTCQHAYKQFLACTRGNGDSRELSVAEIKRLLEETKGSGLFRINIVGGDIFRHSHFEDLADFLSDIPAVKIYFTHYKNLNNRENHLSLIGTDNAELRILVSFPLEEDKFRPIIPLLSRVGIDYGIDFVVQEETDLELAYGIVSQFKTEKASFKACYNGKNAEFLRKALFLSKEDILEARPGLRDIFSRMAVNPLNFGKLFVLSDGTVRASINTPKLGKLGRESLHDLVCKEMASGKSWRKLRTSVHPCKTCTYDLLCPPLTDYEYVLGQSNLCHDLHM